MPIPLGAKAPRIPNWPALRLTERDLPTHFSNGGNIGLILGAASGGLVDIDAAALKPACWRRTFFRQRE